MLDYQALFPPVSPGPSFHLAAGQRTVASCRWIVITFVCRRLRQVALDDCPYLWTDILMYPQWVPKFLARSKTLPIRLRVHDMTHLGDYGRELMFYGSILDDQSYRTKELIIKTNSRKFLTMLLARLPASAPSLRYLSIECTETNYSGPAPISFLSISVPGLRRLELNGYFLPWSASVFHAGLTSLKIHDSRSDPSSRIPSLVSILDALSGMSSLRSLILDNLPPSPEFPSESHRDAVATATVQLPALRSIQLEGPANDCALLLRHLTFSSELKSFKATCGYGASYKPLFEWIAHSFPGGRHQRYGYEGDARSGNGPMRRLRIQRSLQSLDLVHVFEGWTIASTKKASPTRDASSPVFDHDDHDGIHNGDDPQLAISFVKRLEDDDDAFTPMSGFMQSLRLGDVVSLDIAGNANIADEWMTRHLPEMTRLEHVRITNADRALATFLTIWITERHITPDVRYHDTFHQMKSLTIANVHWGFTFRDESRGDESEGRGLRSLFLNALVQRKRIHDRKLGELRVERGDVGLMLETIERFVETVVEEERN